MRGEAVPDAAFEGADWAMAETLAPDGSPEALANPVFFGTWNGPRKAI